MNDLTVTAPHEAAYAPRRLSVIFRKLADDAQGELSVGQIREALGDRSFAAMLAFFAVMNMLPFPPGATLILGPPLVIIAAQMVIGQSRVWLPRFVLAKSVSATRFRAIADRHLPRLLKLETLIRPRYWPFAQSGIADRVIGLICLVLAIIVTIPIPLGNWLPAFAILTISLALSERDGILLGIGSLIGVAALVIVTAVGAVAGALASIILD